MSKKLSVEITELIKSLKTDFQLTFIVQISINYLCYYIYGLLRNFSNNNSNVKSNNNFVEKASKLMVENNSQAKIYIEPGYGTEQVYLGMSREDLLRTLGRPNDEYSHNGYCSYTEMHWYPNANADGTVYGDGIFAFLKDGKIFEIRFGKGYYTKENINYDSSLKDLRNKIVAPLFRLAPSANTSTNNEDLIYMIEKESGIAYELGVGYKTKERAVNAIYVFYPSSDFLPWGCISENQSFTEITDSKSLDKLLKN